MEEVKFNPLLAVSEKYIREVLPNIDPVLFADLRQIVDYYLSHILTTERASEIFKAKMQTDEPITRISAILNVDKMQMYPNVAPMPPAIPQYSRKKICLWSGYEDRRLLFAIHTYGLEDWLTVSRFVGNGRTRAQCAQRWRRSLDPRILKEPWTRDEEEKLQELVQKHGKRAWTKISHEFGNRSDLQCRYHFSQMTRESHEEDTEKEEAITRSSSSPRPKAESIDEMIGTGRPPSHASTSRKSLEDKEETESTS
jgi:hypothetical protein